ncbi:MAG: T9SS type A sorting domain-containing protein [Flavobacteriaceae bacterium]
MKQFSNISLFFIFLWLNTFLSYSQTYTLFDFGSNANSTQTNWNNVVSASVNEDGLFLNLINVDGNYTGETILLNDSFEAYNNAGTTNPASNLPFPLSATRDSAFGEINPFNGNTNPTGGFILSNLDPNKYYSFSIFASRMGVSDNRETAYTVTGQNTITSNLNPSNNVSNTIDILNIIPNDSGTITFSATAGSSNTNSFGFYYLGAIKMASTNTAISSVNEPYLSLIYPNGNEQWEAGKTVSIDWKNYNTSNVLIEYSTNNGTNWYTIATVNPNIQTYDWVVPNSISDDSLVRISAGSLSDNSENSFSIIPNDGLIYKIVVLGSSTAAGTGPSIIDNAWVWRYNYYLSQTDTRFEITNLAVGGFTTYNLLPTGTTIPSGVSHTIETQHNINMALSLNPDGIIINLPSNDANFNYPSADQIANFHLIRNMALSQNVPVWISSPQPKNFGSNTSKLAIQLEMVTETPIQFGIYAIDFWSDFGISSNNGIKTEYNKDGTHMNDTGHRILFDRIVDKGIHTIIKNNVNSTLYTTENNFESLNFDIYPNPTVSEISIKLNNSFDSNIKISIFDISGKIIYLNNFNKLNDNIITINPFENIQISKGIYYCKIDSNDGSITKKIVLK